MERGVETAFAAGRDGMMERVKEVVVVVVDALRWRTQQATALEPEEGEWFAPIAAMRREKRQRQAQPKKQAVAALHRSNRPQNLHQTETNEAHQRRMEAWMRAAHTKCDDEHVNSGRRIEHRHIFEQQNSPRSDGVMKAGHHRLSQRTLELSAQHSTHTESVRLER